MFNYSFYTTTNKLWDKRKKLNTGNVNTFALLKKKNTTEWTKPYVHWAAKMPNYNKQLYYIE